MSIWFKAIFITASIATLVLFFQTYWFVDKQKKETEVQASRANNKAIPKAESIKLLKDSLFVSKSSENYSNFALRLSSSYERIGKYDSAASYKELIANRFSNEENWKNAGLMYYKAFKNASGEAKEQQMATKAIACLNKVNPSNSSEEVKLALATLYLSYDEEVKAVRLLQEVLTNDGANEEALYGLGIHYFQNNNFKKASRYLSQLVKVDSSHINGMYFLALSNLKSNRLNEAKVLFLKLKLLDISAEVKANVDVHLSDIK
ncbi:MAG: tetratricopeptide repeat protein [Cyclobacteriaceae bacterium]|nr:tetratricopeptide repeat protein [Cyclobacteriaceae bacterium]